MDWPLALLITFLIVATFVGSISGVLSWLGWLTWFQNMLTIGRHLLLSWFLAVIAWGACALCGWVWELVRW
ncbi:hypothetical protein [Leifsonia aquatica]|uniref:hypothetical protein n=1 Tax=Leifsonia aquatica TaxID=144185 RepID=UPI00046A7A4A|nr:hypothetical protein [Leifsonia aquatica]